MSTKPKPGKVQKAFKTIRKGMSKMTPEERQKYDLATISIFRVPDQAELARQKASEVFQREVREKSMARWNKENKKKKNPKP